MRGADRTAPPGVIVIPNVVRGVPLHRVPKKLLKSPYNSGANAFKICDIIPERYSGTGYFDAWGAEPITS